jgi:GxxExxY protein
LACELSHAGIAFQMEVPLPVRYKDLLLDCGYRIDLLVRRDLIVEIKSVETLLPIHQAQILTYMRLANVSLGLLINFNVPKLQNGIKRFVL